MNELLTALIFSRSMNALGDTDHTVPYGTDPLGRGFQAFRTWLPSHSPSETEAPLLRRSNHLTIEFNPTPNPEEPSEGSKVQMFLWVIVPKKGQASFGALLQTDRTAM